MEGRRAMSADLSSLLAEVVSALQSIDRRLESIDRELQPLGAEAIHNREFREQCESRARDNQSGKGGSR